MTFDFVAFTVACFVVYFLSKLAFNIFTRHKDVKSKESNAQSRLEMMAVSDSKFFRVGQKICVGKRVAEIVDIWTSRTGSHKLEVIMEDKE